MNEQFPTSYEVDNNLRHNDAEAVLKPYLDIYKQEAKTMSVAEGYVTVAGRLDILASPEAWNQKEGSISLARRLTSGEVTNSDLVEAVDNLRSSYVKAAEGASKRCVDGRRRVGYNDNDPADYLLPLGPQVQGGTINEAVAERIDRGFEVGATLVDDVKLSIQNRSSRFAPGGHTDEHATEDKSGCGAKDGQERKWQMLQDPEKHAYVESATKTLMEMGGLEFTAENTRHQQQQAAILLEHKDEYLSKPEPVFEVLRESNPEAVENLAGSHKEGIVVLNFVKDTTLHTSHYSTLSDGKIDAFGLDVWNIAEEHGSDAAQYLIQDAIQTLMDLTDGSLLVVVRLPKDAEQEQPDFAKDVELALAA